MDTLPINRDNLLQDRYCIYKRIKRLSCNLFNPKASLILIGIHSTHYSLVNKEAILPTRNHIVDIMEEQLLQIIGILHQHLHRTIHKDHLDPLQVLDIIRIHHQEETIHRVHLLLEDPLTHILLLQEIHTQEVILPTLIVIFLLLLVPIILHLLSLGQPRDILLSLYHPLLKTRTSPQSHQMRLLEGQVHPLPIHMLLQ